MKSLTALCEEFAISRPTGYRWVRRYRELGLGGLEEGSRRPQHTPGRTSADVEQRVVGLRQQRPDWGARKLQVLLKREQVQLPAGTIHRILLRHDLVRERDRHAAAVRRFQRAEPNELWQMDFKGPKGWNHPVGPLSVLDDHSRYALTLRATGDTREESVRECLTAVFQDCGLPQAMLMDHGCPWWSGQGERGWTRLMVWLMKQDIRLYFGRYCHPQTQGKVERLHRTMTAALLRRGTPAAEERQSWLDRFCEEYNFVRPHEALGMRTPSQLWRKSTRPYQPHPAPWIYPAGCETVEVHRNGQIRLAKNSYWLSGALAGEQVGLVQVEERFLVFFRQSLVKEIDPNVSGV